MKHQIKLRTQTQVILFKAELQGQISDGFWENSTPHNHWEVPSSAEVSQDKNPGLTFRPLRGYKFHNSELLKVVGDRMIHYVKLYLAFPHLNLNDHHSLEFKEGAEYLRKRASQELDGSNFYWTKKISTLEKAFGIPLEEAEFQIAQIPYDFKALRKDLKEIGLVFKIARGYKPKPKAPKKSSEKIYEVREFAFVNSAGGTGLSNWDFNTSFKGIAKVRVIKHWEDPETGHRFIGEAITEDLIEYLKKNGHPTDQRVFFSEFAIKRVTNG